MAVSYISEHSAEFCLVPILKSILENEFELVLPVFPWISRETSKMSRLLHKDDQFYILAMFPRRPKISEVDLSSIYVTVNEELESFAKIGCRYGIPVMAGCPKAANFWELEKCSEYIWLRVGHYTLQEYLVPVDSLVFVRNLQD